MPCIVEKRTTKKAEKPGFDLVEARAVVDRFTETYRALPNASGPAIRRDAVLKQVETEPEIRAVHCALAAELQAVRERIKTGEIDENDYAIETRLSRFFPNTAKAHEDCVKLRCELSRLAVPYGLLCFCESVSEVATALGNAPTKARLRATTHKIVAKLLENLNEQAAEVSKAISSGSAAELQKLAEQMNLG